MCLDQVTLVNSCLKTLLTRTLLTIVNAFLSAMYLCIWIIFYLFYFILFCLFIYSTAQIEDDYIGDLWIAADHHKELQCWVNRLVGCLDHNYTLRWPWGAKLRIHSTRLLIERVQFSNVIDPIGCFNSQPSIRNQWL